MPRRRSHTLFEGLHHRLAGILLRNTAALTMSNPFRAAEEWEEKMPQGDDGGDAGKVLR